MSSSKSRNRGLGRGLDALFADQAAVVNNPSQNEDKSIDGDTSSEKVTYININDIKPNAGQPRKTFNEEKISELAQSIIEHGIIQPLVVRKKGRSYEIVAGERRWRAARKAELKEIPCLIREFTDEENMLVAIIENMQREDLNPIEEAQGLNQMIKEYGMTQEQVSKSVSKSRPYITNSLRLLKLPEKIQELVTNGQLSTGHARAIITIADKKAQADICRRIIDEDLSVRQVEKLVSQLDEKTEKKPKKKKEKNPQILSLEDDLKTMFGTKVQINTKGRKGKIEFEYYSKEDLNRLIDLLKSVQL